MKSEKLLPSDINADDEEYDDDAIKKYLMKQAIYEKRDLQSFHSYHTTTIILKDPTKCGRRI